MTLSEDSHHWHIAGNGAIGMAMAWHIHHAKQHVCLLSREEVPNPLKLTYRSEELESQWECPTRSRPDDGPMISRLVVATKAHAVAQAIKTWAPALTEDARLYFMQNGREFLPESLPEKWAISYIVNDGFAAYRFDNTTVVQTAHKPILVGDARGGETPTPQVAADLKLLAEAGIELRWTDDIDRERWRKLAVNALINPLTVIFDCHNGGLRTHPEAIELRNAMRGEIEALFAALQLDSNETLLHEHTEDVIKATHENISSMLQDFRHGRDNNELSYIMRPLIHAADAHGIDVPTIRTVDLRAQACFDKARSSS